MPDPLSMLPNFVTALGIGLLIGAERERRKGGGPSRAPAGIRTFTAASLAGAISVIVGGAVMLAVTVAGVAVLTAVAYFRSRGDDPGLTTEIALILTALLGGLAMQQPARIRVRQGRAQRRRQRQRAAAQQVLEVCLDGGRDRFGIAGGDRPVEPLD